MDVSERAKGLGGCMIGVMRGAYVSGLLLLLIVMRHTDVVLNLSISHPFLGQDIRPYSVQRAACHRHVQIQK